MHTISVVASITEWLGVIAVAWLLSLSPRFRHQPIGFKYARRDGLVAVTLALVIVFFSFLFATGKLGETLGGWFPLPGVAAELSRPLALAVLSLLAVGVALLLRGQPLRSAGWSGKSTGAALRVGLALALLTIFLRNRVMDVVNGISNEEAWYLLGAFGIAFAEETIFRGYVQLRLSWWLGETQGWLVAGLAYAAWRLPLVLSGGSLPAMLTGLGLALGQGLVCGWLMRKSGHVLAPVLYRTMSLWLNVFV